MKLSTVTLNGNHKYSESTLKIAKMWGWFGNPFVNDASLDPRPLLSMCMRRVVQLCRLLTVRFLLTYGEKSFVLTNHEVFDISLRVWLDWYTSFWSASLWGENLLHIACAVFIPMLLRNVGFQNPSLTRECPKGILWLITMGWDMQMIHILWNSTNMKTRCHCCQSILRVISGQFGCAFTHVTLWENPGNKVVMLMFTVISTVEMSTLISSFSSVQLCITRIPGIG